MTKLLSAALMLLVVLGCSADPQGDLFLELETDLVPGIEFVGVEVGVYQDMDDRESGVSLGRTQSYALGETTLPLRAGEFVGIGAGTRVVEVSLIAPDATTRLSRIAIVEVAGSTTATVVMTRACEGVACPGAGDDPSALACLGGRCVDPRCTPETPEFCPPPDCSAPSDCAAVAACAEARCDFGVCLPVVRALSCGPSSWCHPELGCQSTMTLHCSDGRQNEGETGVDCGGDCAPCTVQNEVIPGFAWQAPQPEGGTFATLWGSRSGDVWAVRRDGVMFRYEEGEWGRANVTLPAANSYTLSGTGEDDVWALPHRGTLAHWDGALWQPVITGPNDNFEALWAGGPDNVWLGGFLGNAKHFDGTRWQTQAIDTLEPVVAMHGTAAGSVWAAGTTGLWRWDGSAWLSEPGLFPYQKLWAFADNDLWAAGDDGVAHFDGNSWTQRPEFVDSAAAVGFYGNAPDDLWLLREGGALWQWNGSAWVREDVQGLIASSALWGSATELVVAAPGGVFGKRDGAWVKELGLPTNEEQLGALWGTAADSVWTVAGRDVLHWDGAAWSRVFRSEDDSQFLSDLHGTSGGEVWATARGGKLVHREAGAWEVVQAPTTEDLNGLWVVAPNAVFAVGNGGTVLFFDGTSWSAQNTGVSDDLAAVFAPTVDDAFAVGPDVGLRWDGSTWTVDGPSGLSVHGTGSSDVWVSGESPQLNTFHWDGASWSTRTDGIFVTVFLRYDITALFSVSPSNVYAIGTPTGGASSVVLNWRGSEWDFELTPSTIPAMTGLWAEPSGIVWMTGGGVFTQTQ